MKPHILILLLFTLFTSCEHKSGRKTTQNSDLSNCICEKNLCDYCVRVIGITDGDTFKGLTNEKKEIKFRINGIDAPEKNQAFGTRSKEYLSSLIFGKTVGIKYHSVDRYGRLIVSVYTPEGKDVSIEMLKAGMAWHYKQYYNSELFEAIEYTAKTNLTGLWIDNSPIAPWNFRKVK